METKHASGGAVVAVAGRRINAQDATHPRFALERVPAVRKALKRELLEVQAIVLVSSAACGADLIALEEAERLGLRRRIVLPFPPERFRMSSVVDCPGDWGPVFDRQIAAVEAAGDLVVLESADRDNNTMYAAANEAIVREAQALARVAPVGQIGPLRTVAIIIWDGAPREDGDLTDAFRQLAARAGFEERVVLTQ